MPEQAEADVTLAAEADKAGENSPEDEKEVSLLRRDGVVKLTEVSADFDLSGEKGFMLQGGGLRGVLRSIPGITSVDGECGGEEGGVSAAFENVN